MHNSETFFLDYLCEFHNFKTLRGQTVHSLHCKRNPQQTKIRFVAESATLLLLFDLLFHKQIPKSLYRSKSLKKYASLRNPTENNNSEETNDKQMDTDGSPNSKRTRENENSSEDEEKDEEEDRDVIPLFTVDGSISDEANGGEVAEVKMAENEEADRESASGHTELDVEDKDVSGTTAMKTNEIELAKEPSPEEIILIKKPIGNEWPNLS